MASPLLESINERFEKFQFGDKARSKVWSKLANYLRAGVTIGDALDMMWTHMSDDGRKPNHPVAKILSYWRQEIADGKTLGEAIANWVPEGEQIIVSAGEQSNLVQAIDDLQKIQAAKKKIKGTIIKGMTYPVILMIAGCVFLMMFSIKIVPEFNEVLPRPKWTGLPSTMANAGDFFVNYIVVIGIVLVALFFAITLSMPRWVGRVRVFFDKLPPWSLYRLYSGSSFMLIMSSMLSAGSSPLKIIATMRRSASPWLDERMAATERYLRGGENVGDALYNTGFDYPDHETVIDLRSYATQADFSSILRRIGDLWIEESVEKVEGQTSIMKNVAMAFAAAVIIGFLLSIFQLEMQVMSSQGSAN